MAEIANWIWQGTALVAIVSLCTSRLRGMGASMRYRVWWATLALVLALPFFSALELPGLGAFLQVSVTHGPAPSPRVAVAAAEPEGSWIGWLILAAVAAWVIVTAARLYRALAHLEAAKRACRPFPVARERQLARWKTIRNRGRRATLVTSERVRSAGVLGLGYPRIAVAPPLVATLTDDELDQLVIHEYAHVQRRDDVASMIQLLVRCLVGWHPAVWWIDRRLRIEREVACDDWVVEATSAPRSYARCLTRIADLCAGTESSLVPAANRRHQLTTRVVRLLDERRNTSIRPSLRGLMMATAPLVVAAVGLAGTQSAIVTLPSVSRATASSSSVSTPELALNRLLDRLHAPHSARPALTAEAVSTPADAVAPEAVTAHRTESDTVARANYETTPAVVTSEASADTPMAAATTTEPHMMPASHDAPPTATADASASVAEDEASWIDNSRRALVVAGKATGQSLADASVNTGQAIASAGVATYRSGQKSVAKAGRFFSKLGKSLARPF